MTARKTAASKSEKETLDTLVELTFAPAEVETEKRKPKPNPFQAAVNGLKVAPDGKRPEGVKVTVPATMKTGTVYGFLDRAQEARNEANKDHPVTVRRKLVQTDDDGSRVFLIWVINKVVRKNDKAK